MAAAELRRGQRILLVGLPAAAMALLLALFALAVTWIAGDVGQPAGQALARAAGPAAVAPGALKLPGRVRSHAFARLTLALPEPASGQARWVVWIPRDPVEAVWLQGPGWRSERLGFFSPSDGEGPIPGAYVFPLPAGASAVDLHAIGSVAVALRPRLVAEDEAARLMQRNLALNMIAYSGAFTLALLAIALCWTVRERCFLVLFAAAALAGLSFAACNGHLYAFPGLRVLAGLREQGLWMQGLLCAAAVVSVSARMTRLRGRRRLLEATRAVVGGLVAASALLLPGMAAMTPWAQPLAQGGFAVAAAMVLLLLASALRERAPMALPAMSLLLLGVLALAARAGLAYGLVEDVAWARYGYQIALLALLAVLALGLIARIGVYRQQRDHERDARVDSERRMLREAARASLSRALQARLRELAPADVEWTAFRLLFEHLLPQVPAHGAAVIAHGYHGRDVMVTEPIDDQALVEDLAGTRLLMLKRQALAGRPLQYAATVAGTRRVEALVPITIDAHGWGALLLQREAGEAFADDELALAADFVRLTTLHADEAVATQALRRTAELDALTGTLNRRSIDQWLSRHFARRTGQELSLLFVDIDHFKQVNDLYGHACGDHCLRSVAAALRAGLRPQDLLGRYGGEEFIVLLPGCDVATARGMAESLRAAVESSTIEWQGAKRRLTVSIGVATRTHRDTAPASLLDRADSALYAAKRDGRNRVFVSPATFPG